MKIGRYHFPSPPLALAPMEDITDIPFRLVCKRLGAQILFTEFASAEALLRQAQKTKRKLLFLEEERPIGIQVVGNREEAIFQSVRMAEKKGADFIDINCGCWVKNHVQKGEGAALLKDPARMRAIIQTARRATSLPVTVKTRIGWDKKTVNILEIAKMLEQEGIAALTVHCRTRDQGHKGEADWSWLEKIKKAISIPVIGNGDIRTPLDVKHMLETGCDGIMIGRGAIQNPWIFQQTRHFLQTDKMLPSPSFQDRINLCIEHLKMSVHYKGAWRGIVDFRKFYSGYLRGVPHVAKLRAKLMTLMDMDEIIGTLEAFGQEYSLHESAIGDSHLLAK